MTSPIVIVGGGQAGFQVALSLRQAGYTDALHLICAEAVPPYQRPPLSKDYLQSKLPQARLLFRPQDFYAEQKIDVRLSCPVQALNPAKRLLTLANGESMPYGKLVLATGAQARRLPLPGDNLSGVYHLQTLANADALRTALQHPRRWVIIGGGYIGLEVAASVRSLGGEVVVIESAPRVLARVTSSEMSDFFTAQHREHGVTIMLETQIKQFLGDQNLTDIELADGRKLPADIVVLGVGVEPNMSLAKAAGLKTETGIVIDAHGQTSDPHIYACGDCTQFHSTLYGRACHLESVQNAIDQARRVAAFLVGQPPLQDMTPWFWSNQYDVKLQIAGLSQGYDKVVRRGQLADKSFALFYFHKEKLIACDAVNRAAEFMMCRRLIDKGQTPAPDKLADESCAPKNWI